jgi:ATP-dependent helicase/nuclease subunit A
LVHKSIQLSPELMEKWNEGELRWQSGKLEVQAEENKAIPTNAVSLSSYSSSRWRDKLVIRQSGASYFKEVDQERQQKVQYGIYLHALLSRIRYADELERVFSELVSEGFILQEDKEPVFNQIKELLANPVVASWFTRDWDVRTEAPVILPGGDENRIDRLITKGNKAIIIDFKTGEHSQKDRKQVIDYMNILRKMNFADVEGYVLYVRTGDVVSANTSKVKKGKPKDENQLGIPGLM